ncbi:MAG: rod shape-determining protein MreC [Flavobacterium sp.]
MQQIINYIFKNSTKLLFLLLLGVAIVLTIQSHSYHRSKVINSANSVTGGVYERINAFQEYLNLKSENEGLAAENARLKSLLYNKMDSLNIANWEPINIDGPFTVIQSKIIKNSYSIQENILTINTGTKNGVKPFMGVLNSKGIIGIVDITSKNYATVMSVLNVKSKINAKIKKSNHFGTLTWNGKNAGLVQLIDIPRLASVKKGDTIVTGAQSVFPENINIGTVFNIYTDTQTNLHTLDIKLFNDMTSLGHVYVIENKDREELIELEKQSQNEQ